MKNEIGDKQRLQHIHSACLSILRATINIDEEQFLNDELLNAAACFYITIIGEAAVKITKEFKLRHPEFNWTGIKGMRNVIVHEYFGIDYLRLWFTIHNHIPKLKTDCEKALKEFE